MENIHHLRNQLLSIHAALDRLQPKLRECAPEEVCSEVNRRINWLSRHLGIIEKEILKGRKTWNFGPNIDTVLDLMEYYKKSSPSPDIAAKRSDPLWNIIYETSLAAEKYEVEFNSLYLFELIEGRPRKP